MAIIELQEQQKLADVIRGTDVRGILAGHLHYSTHGTFAGIPVSVASATCYTIDASAPPDTLLGVDGGQSINLVNLYDDSVVALDRADRRRSRRSPASRASCSTSSPR